MAAPVETVNLGPDVPGDTRVWRYVSFAGLVALLEMRALHFSHVSAFEDRYDGVFNCLGNDDYYDINDEGQIIRIDADALDARSTENSAKLREFAGLYHRAILGATGVSCWRIDDHESHAMWRVFVRSDEGVAIQSTVDDLARSVSGGVYRLKLGLVQYIDYATQKMPIDNMMNAFFYKSRYFEHEKELRLICYQSSVVKSNNVPPDSFVPLPVGGVLLPVDMDQLVRSIYVSPYAAEWFGNLVSRVVRTYGLDVPVNASAIALRRA